LLNQQTEHPLKPLGSGFRREPADPGRAGGGEELGGLRGLRFYHQRLAVQGSKARMAALAASAAEIAV